MQLTQHATVTGFSSFAMSYYAFHQQPVRINWNGIRGDLGYAQLFKRHGKQPPQQIPYRVPRARISVYVICDLALSCTSQHYS